MAALVKAQKTLLALSGFFICLSYVLIWLSPAPGGYKISIYSHTPQLLWVAISLALLLLVAAPILGEIRHPYYLGLFGSTLILLIAAPWMLDYYLYLSGDAFIHLGDIQAALTNGHLPEQNFYPALHALAVIVIQITGISPGVVTLPILLTFSTAATLMGIILATQFTTSHRQCLIAAAMVSVLLVSAAYTSFAPWAQASAVLILGLYVMTRRQTAVFKRRFDIISLPVIFLVVLFHPLLSVVLLTIIGGALFGRWFWFQDMDRPLPDSATGGFGVLLGVVFLAWSVSHPSLLRPSVGSIVVNLFGTQAGTGGGGGGGGGGTIASGGGQQSFIAAVSQQIQSSDPQLVDILILGFFRHGKLLIIPFAALAFIAAYVSGRRITRTPRYYLLIVTPVFIFIWLGFMAMFLSLPIGFGRFFGIASVAGSIAIGIEVARHRTWQGGRFRTAVTGVGVICVLAAVVLTPIIMYDSTLNKRPNSQVTKMEVSGAEWFITYREPGSEIQSQGLKARRYAVFLEGPSAAVYDSQPPPHFGYGDELEPWTSSSRNVYLLIAQEGKLTYPAFYPNYRDKWKFRPVDYIYLGHDPNANAVYSSGEFTVYDSN